MKARLTKFIFVATLIVGVLGTTGAAYAAVTVGTTSVVSDGALTLTGAAASSWTTSAGALTITGAAASTWSTGAGDLTLDSVAGSLVLDSGESTADAVRIVASAAAGGIDVDAGTGGINIATTSTTANAINIIASGIVAGTALNLDTTDGGIELDANGAANGDIVINAGDDNTITATGILTLTSGEAATWSATTGDLTIDSVAGSLILDSGEATADAIRIVASNAAGGFDVDAGTGGIDFDVTNATTDAFDFTADSITTGDVFDINAAALTEGDLLDLTVAATRTTGAAIRITDASATGVATAPLINIDVNSTNDVNILDITTAAAITAGNMLDVNFAGAVIHTGNGLDITFSDGASTGNAVDLNMGTNVAGDAINIASAATTGNAIEIDLTGATGSAAAIDIATVGLGAANVGAGLNVVGTGTLADTDASVLRVTTNSASSGAASLVDLSSTGALAVAVADGAVLKITETGAAQATTYAVYISSTSNEALHVDTGLVVFDEDLTVGGGDITGSNGDSIDIGEAADSQFTLQLNSDSTVVLTVSDTTDGNTPFTINSAGTGTLTLDSGGAGAIVVGSADVTTITMTTDATAGAADVLITGDVSITNGALVYGDTGSIDDQCTGNNATVDLGTGNFFSLDITDDDADCTVTFANGVAGGIYVLEVIAAGATGNNIVLADTTYQTETEEAVCNAAGGTADADGDTVSLVLLARAADGVQFLSCAVNDIA